MICFSCECALSYEEHACALIEKAYQAKHTSITISSAGRKIVVDLKRFIQSVEGEQPAQASSWLQLIVGALRTPMTGAADRSEGSRSRPRKVLLCVSTNEL